MKRDSKGKRVKPAPTVSARPGKPHEPIGGPCDKCLRLAQQYTEAALARVPSIPQKKLKVDAAWTALEAHMATHKSD
jgi:hypothetical protein